MSIAQIFNQQGHSQFRILEHQVISQILNDKLINKKTVIALGGGSLQLKSILYRIKSHQLIFVDTPFYTCFHRIINSSRPFRFYLNEKDIINESKSIKKSLWRIYCQRYFLYKQSHIIFSPSPKEALPETIDKIILQIR